MKTCSECQKTKPFTDFRKGKGYADGYRGQCKACLSEIAKTYKQRPDVQAHRRETERVYNARPEVRKHRRAWERAYTKRSEVKARVRAYMHRPDVQEHVRQRERQRWQNDPSLREYKRVYLRKRYQENPTHRRKQKIHSMRAIHARRARKQQNGGKYSAQQWNELCQKYNHRCLCCGEAKPLTPDHVVPIARGGSNDISNIQPLCLDCNLQKSTRTIDYRPTHPPEALG